MPPRKVLLGQIARAHGIRGEVLIKTHTAAPENIGAYGPLSDASGAKSIVLRGVRATPKGVVARVEGVSDRNGAEALQGLELYVERDRLPPAAEDEFYHADLVGLTVVEPGGETIGTVKAVQNYGAGDLLEIALTRSRDTELVPFSDAFVPEVDVAARRVVVRMPERQDDERDGEGEI